MLVAIAYDHHGHNSSFKKGSGFACVVQTEEVILFDTGAHGPTLLYNLEKLGFGVARVKKVVISHIDSDHVGGLFPLLERNWEVKVYVPESLPAAFKDLIALYGARVIEVKKPQPICVGVESSGELGAWLKEQSLMLRTARGVVLVVGDAHPGIVSMVAEARRITQDRVYMVLGGFHLSGAPSEMESIRHSFRELGVEKVAPCHSTGEEALKFFREEYQEDFLEVGVGSVIREL